MSRLSIWIVCLAALAGCDADRMTSDDPIWRLYTEAEGATPRYIATFDVFAATGDTLGNSGRCEAVREVLQAARPDVRYVCVVGRHNEGSDVRV